jgi:D-alanine-D-alanine ligase
MKEIDSSTCIIIVLAPFVQTNNENLDYYYDFSQSKLEYKKVFSTLQLEWFWVDVQLNNYKEIIETALKKASQHNKQPIFLNLCDGDEQNNTPGISVIHYLQQNQLIYTGASAYFYEITTSKALMKKAFEEHGVSTPKWFHINSFEDVDLLINHNISFPLILKPSVSGGSIGVSTKNVVHNVSECKIQVMEMLNGYNGWNLNIDGIIAEEFIIGDEFTVFIIGNYFSQKDATIYTPVQRVFHHSLPEKEKFLSFDRLWEIYENETAMPNNDNFYEYATAPNHLITSLQKISWDAFAACKGIGYTRADIRQNSSTGELYVLEVNAQCGISEDENYTSIGAILKASNASFTNAVEQILKLALQQNKENTI